MKMSIASTKDDLGFWHDVIGGAPSSGIVSILSTILYPIPWHIALPNVIGTTRVYHDRDTVEDRLGTHAQDGVVWRRHLENLDRT
jgi:hypothetical protein